LKQIFLFRFLPPENFFLLPQDIFIPVLQHAPSFIGFCGYNFPSADLKSEILKTICICKTDRYHTFYMQENSEGRLPD